jgi:protein-tyrosine phosphatase
VVTRIKEGLYLGDALDAKLLQSANPLNIKTVINVSYETDEAVNGIKNVHIPMMDNGRIPPKTLDDALAAIAEDLRSGPVLVHCAMGVSRSVVLVALHLALTSGASLEVALDRVKELHPKANPAPETVNSGKRYLSYL